MDVVGEGPGGGVAVFEEHVVGADAGLGKWVVSGGVYYGVEGKKWFDRGGVRTYDTVDCVVGFYYVGEVAVSIGEWRGGWEISLRSVLRCDGYDAVASEDAAPG